MATVTTRTPATRDPGIMRVRVRPHVKARGTGWLALAATLLVADAFVNLIWGILAIADDAYFSGDEFLFGGVATWGWLYVGISVVVFTAAMLVFAGNALGSLIGIPIAIFSAIGHLTSISEHPVASGVLLALDAVVLYALFMYGLYAFGVGRR